MSRPPQEDITVAKPKALNFTEDPDANAFLAENPLAVLIGMLLDQQVLMELAFRSPYVFQQRLDIGLDIAVRHGRLEVA